MAKEIVINNHVIRANKLENVGSWEDGRIGEETIQQILSSRDTSGFVPTDEDVLRHLKGDVLSIYVEESTQRAVGFDSINFLSPAENWNGLMPEGTFPDDQGVYFAGALIAGEMQKSGLYAAMTSERIRRGIERGVHLVFTETQNPNVEAGIRNTLESMRSEGEITGYTMDERVLLPGLYGRLMYKEIPRNATISYDALNHEAGDAYALVFNLAY